MPYTPPRPRIRRPPGNPECTPPAACTLHPDRSLDKTISDVAQFLAAVRTGNADAPLRPLELGHGELHQVAAQKMARGSAGHTLQPTTLVHEAWLRRGADAQPHLQDHAHAFAAAAEAMRRIRIDHARRKRSLRHGASAEHVELDGFNFPAPVEDDQLLALDHALQRFSALEPQKTKLVKFRHFIGLTSEQAARVLNVSDPVAKRR